MSNFYVILPSNTVADGNRNNSFRVRLPKKLQFNSEWMVGLAVFVYPHTWPSLGTSQPQFVRVIWKTGDKIEIALPSQNFQNPNELLKRLRESLQQGSQDLVSKLRTIQFDMIGIRDALNKRVEEIWAAKKGSMPTKRASSKKVKQQHTDAIEEEEVATEKSASTAVEEEEEKNQKEKMEKYSLFQQLRQEAIAKMDAETQRILENTAELGLAAWIEAYRRIKFACNFDFDVQRQRFVIAMDNRYIERVELSEQLSYILGFTTTTLKETATAKFVPDMKGGVSSFFIYAPGLIEPVIMGDVTAPILRIVTIRGWPDELIEETYMPIQYHKVLCKEISEIFIEIRTPTGALMPFQYGTCMLTLHFRKLQYF